MSELRQDLVSGDWIIMSTDRAKRPHDLLPNKKIRRPSPLAKCPFEDLQKSGNWPIEMVFPDEKNWKIAVIPNKFPALRHGNICAQKHKHGPYKVLEGIGFHNIVVTRDHKKNFGDLPIAEGIGVFEAFKECFKKFAKDGCVSYISAFANWGASAGASIFHPHYQILALPIVPPNVEHSLRGSAYAAGNGIVLQLFYGICKKADGCVRGRR